MSDSEPTPPSGDAEDGRPTGAQRAARLILPVLLFMMAWMTFAQLPGMAQQAMTQITYEERCPTEFGSVKSAMDDSGLFPSPVTSLVPIGYEGSDGSTYVRAEASCELEYVATSTPLTSEEARSALTGSGWTTTEGQSGAFTAAKKFGDFEYTMSLGTGDGSNPIPVVVRSASS